MKHLLIKNRKAFLHQRLSANFKGEMANTYYMTLVDHRTWNTGHVTRENWWTAR